jgi:membrane protease YdiL (CAAX protease family)
MSEKSPNSFTVRLGAKQDAPPWSLGEMLLALAALAVGTILIGSMIAASVSTSTTNPEPIALLLGWLIGLVIVGAFVVVRWRASKEKFDGLALGISRWLPLLAIMIGIGAAFTAGIVSGLGSGDFDVVASLYGIEGSEIGQLLLAILFVIVQAIVESLIFWGIVLPRLRASLGSWLGLLATIAIFTAYYYLVFGERLTDDIALWYGIINPLIFGSFIAVVRVWSASTRTAMITQIGVSISVIVALLVV